MTTDIPTTETAEAPKAPFDKVGGSSWVVALLFWGTMLIAGALYAAVALSPKLLVYLYLKDDHYQTQVRLVTLERRVMHLKRVMHALEHDPQFAAEQARVELGAGRPGEERVAVDESLHFRPDPDFDPNAFKKSILPWYAPLLDVFARDDQTRRGFLIAAACFSMFAFTFLQESQVSQLFACVQGVKSSWIKATARYRTEKPQ